MDEDYSEFVNGPDQVIPCNNRITWVPAGTVKLRIEGSGAGSDVPISVPSRMKQTATENPELPALKTRDVKTGQEKVWSWSAYYQDVRTVGKAFIDLGLKRFDSVCILGFNTPEWNISYLGAIFAGGLAAGIYPTNGTDACKYILDHSKCSILVVEDQKQLDKIWSIRNELPHLKKIVQYSGIPNNAGVISWKDLMIRGKTLGDDELEGRLRRIAVNQCCTLVYTSGTTGNPKAVMMSHDNLTWNAKTASTIHKFEKGNFRILSYLPLSHIAGNMVDIHAPMYMAGTTYFADKNVLKSTLLDNTNWCKPTVFLGVPRVWEKIQEKMLEKAKDVKGLKKTISKQAKLTGLKYHQEGDKEGLFKVFQKIYYSKVKALLGFDQCKWFFTGAAPIEQKTMNYFMSLDIRILELYGMSESTGMHTSQLTEKFKSKSCGITPEGVTSKLVPSSDTEVTDSEELWMSGRHIMMGYLNREDATRKDMTEDGWLKTGDLVSIDQDGFHFIVGREKDLIITAGGENIAPQTIHDTVKDKLPIISQVLLLGDKQKFISTFLTLSVEVNTDTMEPTNKLSSAARDWCRSVGSNANTIEDILRGPDNRVMKGLQAGIDAANRQAVSNAQKIQKWMILPRDFSLPGGEMGPTMKVKRGAVTKKYQSAVDKIYQN
eukprot:TRINITY_DN1118_c0_g1_i1.p1 TRINITY_DN1118_c0_g1~~TRINITY_DN1118_c0_g1_i1.p1  ORF type:complete len:660 (-),score=151.24 TRINITY_DN1118_c0_g1_i1:339-2318(-)